MQRLGLAQTITAIRDELVTAMKSATDADFRFPVEGVVLEFNVAVEKSVDAHGGVRVWVLDIGGAGGYKSEEIQKVTVSLGAPVDENDMQMKVSRGSANKP
jgi:hypothetical protein